MAKGVELISQSIHYSIPEGVRGSFDLFVSTEPDEEALTQGYTALKQGGSLYTELSATVWTSVHDIKIRFSKIGFDDIRIYLPKPDLSYALPEIWIPVESSGAVGYIINNSTKSVSGSHLKRFGLWVRNVIWSLYPNLFLSYPWLLSAGLNKFNLSVIAHKPESRSVQYNRINAPFKKSTQIDGVPASFIDVLKELWTSWGLGDPPEKFISLMLTRGTRDSSKVVLVIFPDTAQDPSLVVKSTRNNKVSAGLQNETSVLRSLQKDYEHVDGIPKVLYSEQNSEFFTVYESYVGGVELYSILTVKNFRAWALKVTAFLIELAKKTNSELSNDWRNTYVDRYITELASLYNSLLNSELIERSEAALNNFQIPFQVCVHRDLSPKNIFVNSNLNLGVIDWEASMIKGLPAVDLIFFLTRLSSHIDNAHVSKSPVESYRNMLNPSTPTGSVFMECINHYNNELSIPSNANAPLRLMTWVTRIHWHYYNNESHDPRSIQSDLSFNLWKEELGLLSSP